MDVTLTSLIDRQQQTEAHVSDTELRGAGSLWIYTYIYIKALGRTWMDICHGVALPRNMMGVRFDMDMAS